MSGVIVGISIELSPAYIVLVVGDRVMPVTLTTSPVTVIMQLALKPPSLVVAVIVVVPAFRADTMPLSSTVAMAGLLLVHVTLLSVALSGLIIVCKMYWSPAYIFLDVVVSSMPVTLTLELLTVIVQVALYLPS